MNLNVGDICIITSLGDERTQVLQSEVEISGKRRDEYVEIKSRNGDNFFTLDNKAFNKGIIHQRWLKLKEKKKVELYKVAIFLNALK